MADQSDVEAALATLVAEALYPSGANQPSVCGATCRVYRGWPSGAALDADLALGNVNVTVFLVDGSTRNTTRYPTAWQTLLDAPPSLVASVDGVVATFAGTASVGQIAGLAVDGRPYVYAVRAGDTAGAVAANLAVLARVDRIALLSGANVTLPGARRVMARVVSGKPSISEVRRQKQDFRISFWCPDPATRDTVSAVVDTALAAESFIALPDGTGGRLTYASGLIMDRAENDSLFRRDLIYSVDYATTLAATQPAMLFGLGSIDTIARYIG